MNEPKILELFKNVKKNRNELFNLIYSSSEIRRALNQTTWVYTFNGDRGECESLINAGILKAIELFDLSKHRKNFSSFLWTIINQEFTRKIQPKSKLSKYRDRSESLEELGDIDEVISDKTDLDELTHNRLAIEDLIKHSDPMTQIILKELLQGHPYSRIRKILGLTNNLPIVAAIKRIREKFHERYS